jgi:ABC-type uncharacterized transport system YnjBCD substrate-binding protein
MRHPGRHLPVWQYLEASHNYLDLKGSDFAATGSPAHTLDCSRVN